MTCPSAEGFNSIAFLLPSVNHKQQLYPRAIACTCQHASTILCRAVTSSRQFNLFCSQSPQLLPPSCSRYLIFELLPERDVVHTGSRGLWDELDDRWAVHGVTVHLWKMWWQDVTATHASTLNLVSLKLYKNSFFCLFGQRFSLIYSKHLLYLFINVVAFSSVCCGAVHLRFNLQAILALSFRYRTPATRLSWLSARITATSKQNDDACWSKHG